MQRKNSGLPVLQGSHRLPDQLYRFRFIIVLILSTILLLSGCSKNPASDPYTQSLYQQYFEQNILNRDYRVSLATDSGLDITSRYNGYTFRMLKSTLQNGPITVSNSLLNYTGTWSCNDDYSKLVITLPASPPEFIFISREWRFTKKDVTVMELAPWGTTDPKVLHMLRL